MNKVLKEDPRIHGELRRNIDNHIPDTKITSKRIHKFKIYPNIEQEKLITSSCYASFILWNTLVQLYKDEKISEMKKILSKLKEKSIHVKNSYPFVLTKTIEDFVYMKDLRTTFRKPSKYSFGFNLNKETVRFDFNRRLLYLDGIGKMNFELILAFDQFRTTDIRICLDTQNEEIDKRGIYIVLGEFKSSHDQYKHKKTIPLTKLTSKTKKKRYVAAKLS